MSTKEFVGFMATAFAGALLLSFYVVSALPEGTPRTPVMTKCTQQEISRCYEEYDNIFYTYAPAYGSANTLSDEVYNKACSVFTEASSCYEVGFNRCHYSRKANFTRREEGYKAFRALACDKEAYKHVFAARDCVEPRKMRNCIADEHGEDEMENDYDKLWAKDKEQLFCRYGPTQKMCYDKAWNSYTMSPEARQTAATRIMDAGELIRDCEGYMACRSSSFIFVISAAHDTSARTCTPD
ncbi:uncharacterized protein LOC144132469 isoform X2 [Amblyomma americanum]